MTELKAVQIAALEASKGRKGFGFYMEMGLGKTLTDLKDMERLVESGVVTRAIKVCPNSFKGGWADETIKHSLPFDAHIYESGGDNSFLYRKFNRAPCVIVNYEAIRSISVQNELIQFMAHKPTMITFDESIQLMSHDAAQTIAAINLSKRAVVKRILSGKPISRGPHDLWAQMRAIGELDGKNYYAFKAMFCKMGGFKRKQVVGTMNEEYLAPLIEPHVFRANKVDWGFDIGKTYSIREYKMSPEQKSQYNSMMNDFVLWLNSSDYVTVDAAITKYIKLAQIQCGFIIDNENEDRVIELVAPDKNPRVRVLLDILEDEITTKTVIVYVNKYVRNILTKALHKYNPAAIPGGLSTAELEAEKARFNGDPNCRVILVQAVAGKYGHTLIGGPEPINRCFTEIFFQNSYSLDTRSQLEDRPHRFGQLAESVSYIDFCGTDLDRDVINALARKESIFQTVFSKIRKATPNAD